MSDYRNRPLDLPEITLVARIAKALGIDPIDLNPSDQGDRRSLDAAGRRLAWVGGLLCWRTRKSDQVILYRPALVNIDVDRLWSIANA